MTAKTNNDLKVGHVIGTVAVMSAVMALIGYLSASPPYRAFPEGQALIKLSLSIPGKRTADCRVRTPEELAAVKPNMRTRLDCPRQRFPVEVQLVVDGQTVLQQVHRPGGLSGDGSSLFYHRVPIAAGRHTVIARMRDTGRTEGYDSEAEYAGDLAPRQALAVTFDRVGHKFKFD